MRISATLLILATITLTGCSTIRGSSLNPVNWFGPSEPVASPEEIANAEVNPLIPPRRANIFFDNQPEAYQGTAVADITDLQIERRPGGAIVRATGVADRVGPFDVRLIPDVEASTNDTLVLDLRALQLPGPRSRGPRVRQVTVATFVSDQDLGGIRTITVRGANNARTSRR